MIKKVTMSEYKKKMDKILNSSLDDPVDEKLMKLLDEASKYKIVSKK